MATRYPYQRVPLRPSRNEIRLLRFDGAEITAGTPLSCSFLVSPLVVDRDGPSKLHSPEEAEQSSSTAKSPTEALPFSAVSYTWGANPQTATMLIDGVLVQVPMNTEIALRGLITHKLKEMHQDAPDAVSVRNHSCVPLLWIDALCIDQQCLTEKSQQVAMMDKIYSHAEEVLVWLSDDEEDEDEDDNPRPALVQVLNDIYADLARVSDDFANLQHILVPKDERNESLPQHTFIDLNIDDLELLDWFFTHPWFGRIWIVQEIVLAKHATVYWGDVSVPWRVVSLAAQWLRCGADGRRRRDNTDLASKEWAPFSRATLLYEMSSEIRQMLYGTPELSLAMLLLQLRDFNATEPKDNVYALFGLLPVHTREYLASSGVLMVDYSLDLASVYGQATRAAILTTGSTLMLSAAGLHQASVSGSPPLPSWVIRYNEPVFATEGKCVPLIPTKAVELFAPPITDLDLIPQPNCLRIQAHILHTVSQIGPAIAASSFFQGNDEALRHDHEFISALVRTWELASNALGVGQRSQTRRLLGKVGKVFGERSASNDAHSKFLFALTLCCGESFDIALGAQDQRFHEQNEMLLEFLRTYHHGAVPPRELLPLLIHIAARSTNRQFFVTEQGTIGMGPPGIRPGDRAAFLFGCSVPFILRPVDDHWLLMGDVYWTGYMDGLYFTRLRDSGMLDELAQTIDIY